MANEKKGQRNLTNGNRQKIATELVFFLELEQRPARRMEFILRTLQKQEHLTSTLLPVVCVINQRRFSLVLIWNLEVLPFVTLKKKKLHSSCEVEDFVETHRCKLCVILQGYSDYYCSSIAWFMSFYGGGGAGAGAMNTSASSCSLLLMLSTAYLPGTIIVVLLFFGCCTGPTYCCIEAPG